MIGSYMVYRHIRPDKNEPFYIGIGRLGSKRERDKRRNSIWTSIVQKNEGNYEIEIMIDGLTLQEADIKEKEFISLYGRICNGTGCLANILSGGTKNDDYKKRMSVEEKEILRLSMLGNKYAKGKRHTEETKQMYSIVRKGHRPYNRKGTMTEEGKERHIKRITGNKYVSNSGKLLGNTHTLGKINICNGKVNIMINKNDPIPEGWYRGRLKKKDKVLNINSQQINKK